MAVTLPVVGSVGGAKQSRPVSVAQGRAGLKNFLAPLAQPVRDVVKSTVPKAVTTIRAATAPILGEVGKRWAAFEVARPAEAAKITKAAASIRAGRFGAGAEMYSALRSSGLDPASYKNIMAAYGKPLKETPKFWQGVGFVAKLGGRIAGSTPAGKVVAPAVEEVRASQEEHTPPVKPYDEASQAVGPDMSGQGSTGFEGLAPEGTGELAATLSQPGPGGIPLWVYIVGGILVLYTLFK